MWPHPSPGYVPSKPPDKLQKIIMPNFKYVGCYYWQHCGDICRNSQMLDFLIRPHFQLQWAQFCLVFTSLWSVKIVVSSIDFGLHLLNNMQVYLEFQCAISNFPIAGFSPHDTITAEMTWCQFFVYVTNRYCTCTIAVSDIFKAVLGIKRWLRARWWSYIC